MSLASVQQLKDFITSTSASLPASCTDAILQRWLDAASAEIQCSSFCAQPVEQATKPYTFTGLGWREKLLPYHPVASVSNLQVWDGSAWQAVSGTYYLDDRDRIYHLVWENYFLEDVRYKCVLEVGYAAGSIPADIVGVCIEMAALSFYQSPHSAGGPRFMLRSKLTGASTSETYDIDGLRKMWRERLLEYRTVDGV